MKKFFINQISILSQIEKKAIRVEFSRDRTLILGKNGTGKSSLIKSIYRAFGAEVQLHPAWEKAAISTLVKFSVDQKSYSIFRKGKIFAIFDAEGIIIEKFDSVTRGLGPFLANIFDFKIQLMSKSGEYITPPPAFLLLPYYIDQDKSWNDSWKSFLMLSQIPSYRDSMINYHAGIKPNEYYELKKDLDAVTKVVADLDSERKGMTVFLDDVNKRMQHTDFNIDAEVFKYEIEELITSANILKQKEVELKDGLLDIYSRKATIASQMEVVKHAIIQSKRDYSYALDELNEEVECPTCGAHYDNTFIERLDIAKDEQRCRELLLDMQNEEISLNDKINKEKNKLSKTSVEVAEINRILSYKKEAIVLRDVLQNMSRKELKDIFITKRGELSDDIHSNAIKIKDIQRKIKGLEDPDRKDFIVNRFKELVKKFVDDLEVTSLKEDSYDKISTRIETKETGSAKPRALVAYYFAFFHLMKEFSSSTYCPIIIDSPNQQAQDVERLDKILNFINDNQPADTQMILGLEELHGVDFKCKVINLTRKSSLLKKEDYNSVINELNPYTDQMWFG